MKIILRSFACVGLLVGIGALIGLFALLVSLGFYPFYLMSQALFN